MRLYDIVKILLTEERNCRNSDKKLMWRVWEKLGYVRSGNLSRESFLNAKCPTPESVTRCGRKLREKYPALEADKNVLEARRKKEAEKGTFVYREEAKAKNGHWDYSGNTAVWIDD